MRIFERKHSECSPRIWPPARAQNSSDVSSWSRGASLVTPGAGAAAGRSVRGMAIVVRFSGSCSFSFLCDHQDELLEEPFVMSFAGSGSKGMEPSRRMRCVSGAGSRCFGPTSSPKNGIRDVLSILADFRVIAQPDINQHAETMNVTARNF